MTLARSWETVAVWVFRLAVIALVLRGLLALVRVDHAPPVVVVPLALLLVVGVQLAGDRGR